MEQLGKIGRIKLPEEIKRETKIGRSSCVVNITGDPNSYKVTCIDARTQYGCRIDCDDSTLTGCPLRNDSQYEFALGNIGFSLINGEKTSGGSKAGLVVALLGVVAGGFLLSGVGHPFTKVTIASSPTALVEKDTRVPIQTLVLPTLTPLQGTIVVPTPRLEPTKPPVVISTVKIGEKGAGTAIGAVLNLTGKTNIKDVGFPIKIRIIKTIKDGNGNITNVESEVVEYSSWRALPNVVHTYETWELVK